MMTGKNDDAAHTREDSFLAELIPHVTEHLAERHAEDFDAAAGRARFETWLAAHTKEPARPEITRDIIAARSRMEAKRLKEGDDDQTRRLHLADRGQAQRARGPGTRDDDSISRDWTRIRGASIDVADVIRDVNASSAAVEHQYLRARRAADISARSARAAEQSAEGARNATVAHRVIQAEHPRRRAPLPRQVILALATVGLDGVACYFAAQALGGGQDSTLAWTGLFLVVLAGGEAALDFYRDRNLRAWRALAVLAGAFVMLLGVLRFWFLATIGTGRLVSAIAGAGLFAAATGGFLTLGYRALRAAETPQAWRARREARKAGETDREARETADRDARERDRLIDAYLGHVRRQVLRTCPVDQQLALESAVRELLSQRRSPGDRRQRSTRRIAPLAAGLLAAASRLLPAADRDRYDGEYRSELWERAQSGAGRLGQLRYALGQLRRAPRVALALRSPRHRGAAP